jgi:hypothetical protein
MQYRTISKLFEAYDGIEVCGMFLISAVLVTSADCDVTDDENQSK